MPAKRLASRSRTFLVVHLAAILAVSTFAVPTFAVPTIAFSVAASETPTETTDEPSIEALGARLERFEYPYPVQRFELESQGRSLEMAYLDVRPTDDAANGETVVLLHGKNFCAATWETVIGPLRDTGYRVVAPDQIGFCKSSRPRGYQFSFHQLAHNTKALLDSLGVERPIVMGHSMGGMLATRYALLFPGATRALVLANPIGLEDWIAQGVPYRTVDQWYTASLDTDFDSIKSYQKSTYYAGTWEPRYDRWVEMLAGQYASDRELVAWMSALTYDMIVTQPVVHQLGDLEVPTLLLIGAQDHTAIGKGFAPPEVAKTLGDYPRLARAAERAIPHATLVLFDDLGHSPQIQAPDRFNESLLSNLSTMLSKDD